MNKATLLGILTEPIFDNNDEWVGADISAHMEVEVSRGKMAGVHRAFIQIPLTPMSLYKFKACGYYESAESYIMNRVKYGLNGMVNKFKGTQRDADNIYEVIRLKMPRFVSKSVEGLYYSQNFRTGEIFESKTRH